MNLYSVTLEYQQTEIYIPEPFGYVKAKSLEDALKKANKELKRLSLDNIFKITSLNEQIRDFNNQTIE